jgi:hypothetical protein
MKLTHELSFHSIAAWRVARKCQSVAKSIRNDVAAEINRQECSIDLAAGEFDAAKWEEWWLYCPNSAMLRTIGALQKCGPSPRYATADDFSHLRQSDRVSI